MGLDLLLRKMPFPYSDLTDRSRLLPGYRIPAKAAFRNDIRDEDVDEAEWASWEEARQKAGTHDWRGTICTWPPTPYASRTSSRNSAG